MRKASTIEIIKKRILPTMLALLMAISGVPSVGAAVSEHSATVKHAPVPDPGIVAGYVEPTVNAGSLKPNTVVRGEKNNIYSKEIYFMFGSHMAWAYSFDLQNWTPFTNNINTDYAALFAKEFAWAESGDRVYSPENHILSPDVLWNPELEKWCMYISITGHSWNSAICMLTADSLRGSWSYADTVVYSGFNPDGTYGHTRTDYAAVTGDGILPSRYTFQNMYQCSDGTALCARTSWNYEYGAHAADPCVFYDAQGRLWMFYGTDSGGIWMLRLDAATGLRDLSVTYDYVNGETDPYMGYHIAGGNNRSGTASCIRRIGSYYYLFATYEDSGSDSAEIRMFRAEDVTGPYKDQAGNPATGTADDETQRTPGARLMSDYKWSYMNMGCRMGGHNSILADDDGKMYVVYQTRGSSAISRVHQIFMTEGGWPAAAPFEYSGEMPEALGADQAAGAYEVVFHGGADGPEQGQTEGITISLSRDGTIAGDRTGSWRWSEQAGSPYVTMTVDGKNYEGVFLQQKKDNAASLSGNLAYPMGNQTAVFSMLCTEDGTSVWGYNLQWNDSKLLEGALDLFGIQSTALSDVALPDYGPFGTQIIWESDHPEVLAPDGTVAPPEEPTVVTLTATFLSGHFSRQKQYEITVYPKQEPGKPLILAKYFTDTAVSLAGAGRQTYCFANPFLVEGIRTDNGVSIQFDIQTTGIAKWSDVVFSFHDGTEDSLYLNGQAYLGCRAENAGTFDANIRKEVSGEWRAGTDFIGSSAKVEVRILPDGFAMYVNGRKVYDQNDVGDDFEEEESQHVPGEISMEDLSRTLDYVLHTASTLNFGWSPSGQGGYHGMIGNVVVSVLPIAPDDGVWHEHEYQVEVTPATRRTAGKITYTCLTCDDSTENHRYTETFPMIALGVPDVSLKVEDDGMQISWDRQEEADGYYLYRKTGNMAWSDIPYAVIEGGSALDYMDTHVMSGYSYTYAVCAFNSVQTGGYRTEGRSRTYLEKPQISQLVNTASGIQLRWSRMSGAAGYRIYRKTGKTGRWAPIGTTVGEGAVAYMDKTAQAGMPYYYSVSSYAEESESTYDMAGTGIVRLGAVSVTKAAAVAGGVTVKWKKAAGAKGYYIYRRIDGGSYRLVKKITGGSTVQYLDKGAVNGKKSTYKVAAYNGSVVGASAATKFAVYLTQPKLSKVVNSPKGAMTVRYGKNTKASGYEIQYSTKSGFRSGKRVKVRSAKTTKAVIKKLKKKTYYVRVRIYRKSGKTTYYSAWSSKKKVKIAK